MFDQVVAQQISEINNTHGSLAQETACHAPYRTRVSTKDVMPLPKW